MTTIPVNLTGAIKHSIQQGVDIIIRSYGHYDSNIMLYDKLSCVRDGTFLDMLEKLSPSIMNRVASYQVYGIINFCVRKDISFEFIQHNYPALYNLIISSVLIAFRDLGYYRYQDTQTTHSAIVAALYTGIDLSADYMGESLLDFDFESCYKRAMLLQTMINKSISAQDVRNKITKDLKSNARCEAYSALIESGLATPDDIEKGLRDRSGYVRCSVTNSYNFTYNTMYSDKVDVDRYHSAVLKCKDVYLMRNLMATLPDDKVLYLLGRNDSELTRLVELRLEDDSDKALQKEYVSILQLERKLINLKNQNIE